MQAHVQCVSWEGNPEVNKIHVVLAFTDSTTYKKRLIQGQQVVLEKPLGAKGTAWAEGTAWAKA